MNRANTPSASLVREPRWSALLSIIVALFASSGCSNIERSRALGDPAVPAQTIALQVCSTCHGLEGRSTSPNFPNLAAQRRDYLIEELVDFRSGNRRDPAAIAYMWGMAHGLADAQILGLAEYFAHQEPAAPVASDDGLVANGRKVYEREFPDRKIRSCGKCHGVGGEGSEQFPRLAAQHADYLVKQLKVFKRKDERPDGSRQSAHDLSCEDMEAVGAYLQALP